MPPDHFQTIYANYADQYDRLVSVEDPQGNLLSKIMEICPLAGLDVVEMGAGTGRVTRLLAPHVRSIRAYDASAHMLSVAEASLRERGLTNWQVAVADNRALPAADSSADLAIEGWSFGHMTGWYPDTWRDEMDKAIVEMMRVLRPGGAAILIETLGTGRETPQPPSPGLAAMYDWLESDLGFTATWIRTDIHYESLSQAEELTRFFFQSSNILAALNRETLILPECTGLWWRGKA